MTELEFIKFINLSSELSQMFLKVLDASPKENNYLRYLTESCLLFTSYVAYIHDEHNNCHNKNIGHGLSPITGKCVDCGKAMNESP